MAHESILKTGLVYTPTYGEWGISNGPQSPSTVPTYSYYSTLTSAMTAAGPGDTIELFTSVSTVDTVTLKDGVNINLNGHTYTFDSSGNENAFDDADEPVRCRISNGTIVRTGNNGSHTEAENLILKIVNNGTYIRTNCLFLGSHQVVFMDSTTLEGGTYRSNKLYPYGCIYMKDKGILKDVVILKNTEVAIPKGTGIYSDSDGLIKDCVVDVAQGSDGITLQSSGKVQNCIVNSDSTGISLNGGSVAIGCVVKSTGTGISIADTNSKIYNCQVYVKDGDYGMVIENGGKVINSSIYANNTTGIRSGSFFSAYNCSIISSSVGIETRGGSLYNCSIKSSAGSIFYINTTDLTIKNCYLRSETSALQKNGSSTGKINAYGCTFQSDFNNTNGHSVYLYDANPTHNFHRCVFRTIYPGAYGIFADTAGTNIRYTNNAFIGMNTAVNTNIAQASTVAQSNRANTTSI